MSPFDPQLFLSTLALIGAVIIISSLLSGLIERSGLPQVAVFLGLGALIGPIGLNLFNADLNSPILRVVGTLSLVLVLFTDAVSLNLAELRKHRVLSALVLGPGTLFSAVLIAVLSWWMLGLHPAAAAILGAALASTDPVLLRGLIRSPNVNSGVRQALRLESGMNDAVLLPIVFVGMTVLRSGDALTGREWARLGMEILILSPAAGTIVALAAIGMLELVRRRIGVRRDYESIYSLGVAFAAFAAAEAVDGSGYVAAFAAGLTISALDVELCDCFLEYGETTAEMALMFSFVLFGTSLIWTGLGLVGMGGLLFAGLVFAARPAAFLLALLPVQLSWKNRAFIAWFGPRGLSSLLLILLPVFSGIPGSERLVSICCLVVLSSVLLHGLSFTVFVKQPPGSATGTRANSDQTNRAAAGNAPAVSGGGNEFVVLDNTEYISIGEVQEFERQGAPTVIVDARSERSYAESDEEIPGAVRLHPEHAVADASAANITKNNVLAVLCA